MKTEENIEKGSKALTDGLQSSNLVILGSRPGKGKTSLALNIALNAAVRQQGVVFFFSIEMNANSILNQLQIMQKWILEEEMDLKLVENISESNYILTDTKLVIDDNSNMQIGELESKCKRLKVREGRVDLVVIDYLQLFNTEAASSSMIKPNWRGQEIAEVMRRLKQIACDLECPVLVLSQLSRESVKHEVPILSDLRDSEAIEPFADLVLLIYENCDPSVVLIIWR